MKLVKRILIIILVSLACAGCDQGTKSLADSYLSKSETISYFYDTVRIGYTENSGAFLGLGGTLPEGVRFFLFKGLVGVFLILLLFYVLYDSKLNLATTIGLSLVFSGGASNLYDRVVNGGVVIDFLNIGIGDLRTGVFNVADMAIMFGGALALFAYTHHKQSPRKNGFTL